MGSHRVAETGFTAAEQSSHHKHHMAYTVLHGMNNPSPNFVRQERIAFDFGELEEAIVFQEVKSGEDEEKTTLFTVSGRPAATLEMFPSWPMRFQQQQILTRSINSGGESTVSGKLETQLDSESPVSRTSNSDQSKSIDLQQQQQQAVDMAVDACRAAGGPSNQISSSSKLSQDKMNLGIRGLQMVESESDDFVCPRHVPGYLLQEQNSYEHNTQGLIPKNSSRKGLTSEKQHDPKTLRRLAQNREAARKSRLRKKAYVQQLESSRIKLSHLEQELQRARQQGLFLGSSSGNSGGSISSGAAIFDMEYARWLEEDHRHISELRTGLNAHLTDADLRVIIDRYITHYDDIFRLKGVAAKSDVFHLITGMWSTPAERCFLWMGGFRPSDLIKMLAPQLDPLTEQQLMGIYSLQHSSQHAEEALSQGLEELQQSLVNTIAGGAAVDAMQQMAVALSKLANLEGFVRQADNLRQQTLHQLRQTLTVRQAARCFLMIGEYYGRLRALSSLWASRPRDTLIGEESSCLATTIELQMIHPSQNLFPTY